jgi:hypothetical protein
MKTTTALFIICILSFAVAIFYKEPPASEVVSVSKLEKVVEIAQRHPDQSAPYLQKIKSGSFTNADYVMLKAAITPIEHKLVESESSNSIDQFKREHAPVYRILVVLVCLLTISVIGLCVMKIIRHPAYDNP